MNYIVIISLISLFTMVNSCYEECPKGWTAYEEQCLWSEQKEMTRDQNLKKCEDLDSTMVSLKSKAKAKFITTFANGTKNYWLSAVREKGSKKFNWDDGSSVSSNLWHAKRQNSANKEDTCTSVCQKERQVCDDNCNSKYFALCERPRKVNWTKMHSRLAELEKKVEELTHSKPHDQKSHEHRESTIKPRSMEHHNTTTKAPSKTTTPISSKLTTSAAAKTTKSASGKSVTTAAAKTTKTVAEKLTTTTTRATTASKDEVTTTENGESTNTGTSGTTGESTTIATSESTTIVTEQSTTIASGETTTEAVTTSSGEKTTNSGDGATSSTTGETAAATTLDSTSHQTGEATKESVTSGEITTTSATDLTTDSATTSSSTTLSQAPLLNLGGVSKALDGLI